MGPELIPGEKAAAPAESQVPESGPLTPWFTNAPLHCIQPICEDGGIVHEGKAETTLFFELVPFDPVEEIPAGNEAAKPTAGDSL